MKEMQKRKLSKYEISKQDRLRRVKNQSNKREWLLAGAAALLGTAAVVFVGNSMAAKSENAPQGRGFADQFHMTSTQDIATPDPPRHDGGFAGNADDELIAARETRESFLNSCLYFDYLRKKGKSFSQSLTIIQGGIKPTFNRGIMTHRDPQDQFNTRDHHWFKIWCYLGGKLNTYESKNIPGGCNEIDNTITLGGLVISRNDIEEYVDAHQTQLPLKVVNMIAQRPFSPSPPQSHHPDSPSMEPQEATQMDSGIRRNRLDKQARIAEARASLVMSDHIRETLSNL